MLLDTFFILSAQYLLFVSIIISCVYFLKQPSSRQKQMLIFGLLSVAIIYTLSIIAGYLYNDPRPFVAGNFTPLIKHAPDNGFPSDHVLLLSAIAAIMTYFTSRKIYLTLWLLVVLVGVARVYVGVHHSIDIIGSIIISLVGVSITRYLKVIK